MTKSKPKTRDTELTKLRRSIDSLTAKVSELTTSMVDMHRTKPNVDIKPTHFTYDQDTVTDLRTGLMWQRHISEDSFSLKKAKQYADNLRLGDYADWRVPTRPELESIVDLARHHPSINIEAFPNTPSCWFWSVSPGADGSSYAWVVSFYVGGYAYGSDVNSFRVRCVRGTMRKEPSK